MIPFRQLALIAGLAGVSLLTWVPPTQAKVVRIVIDSTIAIAGQPTYEQVSEGFVELARYANREDEHRECDGR